MRDKCVLTCSIVLYRDCLEVSDIWNLDLEDVCHIPLKQSCGPAFEGHWGGACIPMQRDQHIRISSSPPLVTCFHSDLVGTL